VQARLDVRQLDSGDLLTKVTRARDLTATGEETLRLLASDSELAATAKAAMDEAAAARAKVSILYQPAAVGEQLLGKPGLVADKGVVRVPLDGVVAFLVLDGAGRCRGIYAVGGGADRVYNSPSWPADRLLSQAVGHAATMSPAPKNPDGFGTAHWSAAGTAVTARWRNTDLVELRIGDASP
jgi:hypothetical protein